MTAAVRPTPEEPRPVVEMASGVSATWLHAEFLALGATDANDGETVVCYRSYLPAARTAAY